MTKQVDPTRTARLNPRRDRGRPALLAAALLLAAAATAPMPRAFAQDAAQDTATTTQDPAAPAAQDPPAQDPPPQDPPAQDPPAQDPPAPAPDAATETQTETTVMQDPDDPDATVRVESTTTDDSARANARADKSEYSITNPTPRELMRPLSADRPDVTETPYTVDAGHIQVELSFFEYARDEGGAVTEFDLLPFIAKVGLTNSIDLQLGVVPYVDVDFDFPGPGGGGGDSGFGPVELRAKFNIWGNDGGGAPFDLPDDFPESMRERWGDSAFALMPYVRFPTGPEDAGFSNDVEFGVAAPLQTPITDDWDLGAMLDVGIVRGPDDGSYKLELLHTLSAGRNLGGRLGGYGEYVGVLTGQGGTRYLASIGVGLIYQWSDDLQLDAAINVGLNDDPEDFRFLTGLTWRR